MTMCFSHNFHNKTSNIEVSEKLTEFHKFFWAINCCSYNTHNFPEIFAFPIFAKFSHFTKIFSQNFRIFARKKNSLNFASFSLYLFSRKNAKVCEMRTKIFAFFSVTFRSLETLVSTSLKWANFFWHGIQLFFIK